MNLKEFLAPEKWKIALFIAIALASSLFQFDCTGTCPPGERCLLMLFKCQGFPFPISDAHVQGVNIAGLAANLALSYLLACAIAALYGKISRRK